MVAVQPPDATRQRPDDHLPDDHQTGGAAGDVDETYQRELAAQRAAARERVDERAPERQEHEEALQQAGGLAQADDPVRIAKRLDRLSRYYTGGDPAESPADVQPEVLVAAAVERARDMVEPDEAHAVETSTLLLEKIINTADFVGVRYLDAGVIAAHAIGRVNIRDVRGTVRGYGTGFLVSPSLLITNHHVLPDAPTARSSVIEFDYQDGVDGRPLAPQVFPLDPARFFVADRGLDFALVAVGAPTGVLAQFGFNRLTAAQGTIIIGEFVTIVQHPRGEKKQVALRENQIVDIPELVVHYAADTEPGSSGSPVFNDQWEVVALHHASVPAPTRDDLGGFVNEGIRISRILNFLAARVDQLPPEWRPLLDEMFQPPEVARPVVMAPGTVPAAVAAAAAAAAVPASVPPARPQLGGPAVAGEVDDGMWALPADGAWTARPDRDGAVHVRVPVDVTFRVGTPGLAVPGPGLAPAAAGGAPPTAVGGTGAPADGGAPAAGEAISIDPDYSTRSGYDRAFLTVPLPLPGRGPDLSAVASDELRYHHFSVVMHRPRRLALFTAVNIDGKQSEQIRRESDKWIRDPRLPAEDQTGEDVYRDNPLDRGHLVRRLDPAWGPVAKAANDDTFHFTNCTPQHHEFNAGQTLWLGLEDYVLRHADNLDLRVTVVTGPLLDPGDPRYRGVALPRQFWKVVAMVTGAGRLSATGYLLSQAAFLDDLGPEEFSFGAYRTFQVPVTRLARLTGLDLAAFAAGDPLGALETTPLPRELIRLDDIVLDLPARPT
ncbi:DNA/RNA non-specific endonuclease [Georgenia yuyongxinii]|uniref:DNA/RNA non-specific endonuclease n=3 Tax=Georgenia yuyongxinii TaxID=2589797 RepID=UPI001CB7410F|nr:DNA/RNA non-specific endonuclease [Georgenia yuyongxinii]